MDEFPLTILKNWFFDQQRDFPWRKNPTPYSVWVSEVMLQQTQASVVVPYFLRWMNLFPSVHDLAQASLDNVIKAWEGLGYYSRARNLHLAAQHMVEFHDGQVPDTAEALLEIKGLGPYTVGAILSFAFHKRIEAVDGNVLRVLARYYGIAEDISQGPTIKKIRSLAKDLLPENESWIINEALIELGALVCGRKAKCNECPLKSSCKAYSQGLADKLPAKSSKNPSTLLYRTVGVVRYADKLLVRRTPKGKVMSDLYEFPYFDVSSNPASVGCPRYFENLVNLHWNMELAWEKSLPKVQHSFTRYRACLHPHLFFTKQPYPVPQYDWIETSCLQKLAFSSGHRRIFANVAADFCS